MEIKGLNDKEVLELREKYGKNEIVTNKKESFIVKIIHIICEPMFLLLIAASTIYFVLGEVRDGFIMFIFIFGIIIIDIIQEWKTDKTLNALKSMDNSIVDIYHEKTGLDKTEILQLMEEETWFTSEEAVKHNFADNVITTKGGDSVAKHTKNDIAKRIVAMLNEEEIEETEVEEVDYEKRIKDIERRLDALEKRVNETVEEETTENNSSRFFF